MNRFSYDDFRQSQIENRIEVNKFFNKTLSQNSLFELQNIISESQYVLVDGQSGNIIQYIRQVPGPNGFTQITIPNSIEDNSNNHAGNVIMNTDESDIQYSIKVNNALNDSFEVQES